MSNAKVIVHADTPGATIHPNIYGHFAEHLGRCIYEGFWVGEDSPIPNTRGIRNDVVAALKQLNPPILRWPGGCFADEYHWKDGIGPKEQRPSMINTHWGGVVETNHFGTHEFLDLCEQLGTEPYICGNVGSGTPQEMMEWVEYMTSDADTPLTRLRKANGRPEPWRVAYFGVGNESWGCGGNMRPEFYADNYRRYNTFVKNYGNNRIYRVACGPNSDNYRWTEVLMEQVGHRMNGLAFHHYTIPTGNWQQNDSATEFGEDRWHSTLFYTWAMKTMLTKHIEIMDRFDPQKRVGLVVDEWGTWYDVEPGTNPGFLYQQNTLRDALVAALHFHFFQEHADRVVMANIAQTVNVLQAMILTAGEKMLLTPTYHVFEMYKGHQGATFLPCTVTGPEYTYKNETIPAISVTASRNEAGQVRVGLVNCLPETGVTVSVKIAAVGSGEVTGRVLTADTMNAHNTFDAPETVQPQSFTAFQMDGDTLIVELPAKSVVILVM